MISVREKRFMIMVVAAYALSVWCLMLPTANAFAPRHLNKFNIIISTSRQKRIPCESTSCPSKTRNLWNHDKRADMESGDEKKSADDEQLTKSTNDERPSLFINIIIHNVSELITARVNKRIERSNLPERIKSITAKNIGRVASTFITNSKVARIASERLCDKIPRKMKEKGLTVVMKEVFREGTYVVLELQVKHVDSRTLERTKQEKKADTTIIDNGAQASPLAVALVDWTIRLLGNYNQQFLEEDFLPQKIQKKLEKEMMTIIEKKFEGKKVQGEVRILQEEKQAKYFYAKLKETRAARRRRKTKSSLDAN